MRRVIQSSTRTKANDQSQKTLEIIERLLAKRLVQHGTTNKLTVLEAIIRQLWQIEIGGDNRALKVRQRYQEFLSNQVMTSRKSESERQVVIINKP